MAGSVILTHVNQPLILFMSNSGLYPITCYIYNRDIRFESDQSVREKLPQYPPPDLVNFADLGRNHTPTEPGFRRFGI